MEHFISAWDNLPVAMQFVTWDDYSPLFSNEPQPLWIVVPVWIRPGTVVMTLESIAASLYGAQVFYKIETGKTLQIFMFICTL